MSRHDRRLEEASANLGATRLGTLRYVILPLSVPGIGAGAALGLAGGSIAGDPKSEAVAALQQLGYKPAEASRMAQKVAEDGDDAETIIRKALKSALKT